MNKKILMILLAGLILIGLGIAGLYLLPSNDNSSSSSTDQTSNASNQDNQSSGKEFKAIAMKDRAFEATLKGNAGDSEVNATILSDGKGNSKYSGEADGEKFESYITADGGYILCNDGSCFKLPTTQEQTGLDPSTYTYDEEDYNEFRSIAKYIGTEDCPAGTCDVWQIEKDGATTKVFVSNDSYVSKLTVESPDGFFTYTYTYKDVSFNLPNIQSLPVQTTN